MLGCNKLLCKDCGLDICVCKYILLMNNLEPHKCYFKSCKNDPFYFHKNGNLCYYHKNEMVRDAFLKLKYNKI